MDNYYKNKTEYMQQWAEKNLVYLVFIIPGSPWLNIDDSKLIVPGFYVKCLLDSYFFNFLKSVCHIYGNL